jgi:hypothetical protein
MLPFEGGVDGRDILPLEDGCIGPMKQALPLPLPLPLVLCDIGDIGGPEGGGADVDTEVEDNEGGVKCKEEVVVDDDEVTNGAGVGAAGTGSAYPGRGNGNDGNTDDDDDDNDDDGLDKFEGDTTGTDGKGKGNIVGDTDDR